MKKAASYARISTLIHGQDLNNQLIPIDDFCQARDFDLVQSYTDEGISGAKERRKGLDLMLSDAKKGKFKILIVMEISRLARDLRHLLNLINELDQIGVSIISIREGLETDSILGRAMISMIGIFMEVERNLLRERIKTSLAIKKLAAEKTGNGWTCGRPLLLTPDMTRKIINLRQQGKSYREIERLLDKVVSKSSIARVCRDFEGKSKLSQKGKKTS